jgi:signal transduction histidine kinase
LGTKLRSISTSILAKILAASLAVIFITAAVVQIHYLSFENAKFEALFVKDYQYSDEFLRDYGIDAIGSSAVLANGDGIQKLDDEYNYYYYIAGGKKTLTNSENTDRSFFSKHDRGYYAFEKGTWAIGEHTNSKAVKYYVNSFDNKYTVYIAFKDEFMNAKQQEWQQSRSKLVPVMISTAILIVLALILLIYLIAAAGRRTTDSDVHLSRIDHIYSDILLFSFFAIGMFWLNGVLDSPFYSPQIAGTIGLDQVFSMVWVGAITAFIAAICIVIFLSIVRKIKAKKFLSHSLIFIAFYKVYDFLRSLFDGRRFAKYPLTKSLFFRQLVFICASAVFVFLTLTPLFYFAAPPLFFVPVAAELVMIYWYIKGNNKTFTDINKGFNESFEEQMKAERMKIALVTNVSHDLKTPLTSIISYVDLLSDEEGLTEAASDYVKILAEKSDRLKNIVADLFDLAKSTSGDIALDLEPLDLKKLIEQTLGDMEDEIEKSGLQIKTDLVENPVNIIADGKKMYRVFQNVIGNALKYALKDTRIFVNLEEADGKAIVKIKNIAAYEMDFTADEILQRFSRGDKARTTEGSGLGLSIAESFTKVCGGDFKVEIDGDMFKVVIVFNEVI